MLRGTFRLIGLKNIFARQLPNMPKEYIVRLVMDRYYQLLHVIYLGGETMRPEMHISVLMELFYLTSPFRPRALVPKVFSLFPFSYGSMHIVCFLFKEKIEDI